MDPFGTTRAIRTCFYKTTFNTVIILDWYSLTQYNGLFSAVINKLEEYDNVLVEPAKLKDIVMEASMKS